MKQVHQNIHEVISEPKAGETAEAKWQAHALPKPGIPGLAGSLAACAKLDIMNNKPNSSYLPLKRRK